MWRAVFLALALLVPVAANAHGFGRLYNLPVPFWLYAWAAAAALVVSFVIAAFVAGTPQSAAPSPERDISRGRLAAVLRRALPWLRALALGLLVLTIATALAGNRDPYRNFSMTAFWVVFLLGFTYFTAAAGNVWAAVNPWRTLCDLIVRCLPRPPRALFVYREAWSDWPALALYLGFIWFELFGLGRPKPLGWMLVAYTAINLGGAALFGRAAWFRHGEFFSVLLRLVALVSPWHYERRERSLLVLRAPLSGLVQERPAQLATVVFVLAMLSTTAFDGLRATQWWVQLFWKDSSSIVTALGGAPPMSDITRFRPWYIAWETFWLVASPFVYLAFYVASLALARALTRSRRGLRPLALDFAYSLLPIALVYHATHYATLMLTQGLKIVSLASDPFGRGWDLFGTVQLWRAPILPGMGTVWHTQVGLILVGHIVSVWIAHRVALRVFETRRAAFLSQLPLLALMVAFTVAGLWIIAQPLTVELMR